MDNNITILNAFPGKLFDMVYRKNMQCGVDCFCIKTDNNIYDCEFLYSYNSLVAGTINGKVFTRGYYSNTTSRHQNVYIKQYCAAVPVKFDALTEDEQNVVLYMEHNRDYTNYAKRGY